MSRSRYRRTKALVLATLLGLVAATPLPARAEEWLAGRLLVAAPDMQDPNFERTVICLIHHDEQGAFGVVVNVPLGTVPLEVLLSRITPSAGEAPPDAAPDEPTTAEAGSQVDLLIHYGGPVEPRSLGLLHSPDVMMDDSLQVEKGLAFTRDPEILNLIQKGEGPEKSLFTLGYSGWAPGQLDGELKRGSWYVIAWSSDLVFNEDINSLWDRAVALGGPEL